MKKPLLKDEENAAPPVEQLSTGLDVPEYMVYFVYVTVFIDVLAAAISTPVMPYYAQQFEVPVQWIGYLYGAWSLSATLFAPMLSGMSDTWGRKTVLVSCLVGAGVANVIQGAAVFCGSWGFWIFLFGRAFSGVWASVGATCNVYISDVASESVRGAYLEKLAMVPVVAILVGPGLGGGLATAFGNNTPVLMDGIMTLFSACLVAYHLTETPAFLRTRTECRDEKCAGGSASPKADPVPFVVQLLGASQFLDSLASQCNLSMLALFYQGMYDLSSLYVGFIFIGSAVMMLMSQLVIVPTLKKFKLPPLRCACVGCVMNGIGVISLGLSSNLWYSLAAMCCYNLGSSINRSQNATIISSFTSATNRGKIFGTVQVYQNAGKIVGPILATNVAIVGVPALGISGFLGLPFVCSGCFVFINLFVLLGISSMAAKPVTPTPISRRNTEFGDDWINEEGSKEDVQAIGKYVAELLTKRHYKWVSRRSDVEKLFDQLLPELETSSRDAYEASFNMRAMTGAIQAS
eukprot:TRINITY_DN80232_c0_g1_i1.p1 TRINITY_DN80232_c0_g1~~TRINITY_DN80232_c0_g1_i1.p1  ORF type:complete len:549 (-),score=84.37 TRINITY_DN80232_c0_g1_i1:282-1838(-)